MKKYIITGKNSQETAASMLNKPQNRREITEPLAKAFGAEFIEFLYLNHPDFDFMCIVMAKNDEDIAADDLLDYKDQLKVESFNSESLYQILEDELGSTKTLIQDQDVNSTQAGFTGPLIITTVPHSGL